MQAKGFIKFIITGLLFFAIYQLSFTLIGSYWNSKANTYATEYASSYSGNDVSFQERKAKVHFIDSIKNLVVLDLWFTKLTYDDINKQQLKLGLDLKGGISLLVEIDNADLLKELSHKSDDKFFNEAIQLTKQEAANSQDGFLDAFEKNYNKISDGGKLAAIFAPHEEFKGKVNWEDSNEDVMIAVRKEIESTWDKTHEILVTRIDQFGVANPFISKPDNKGRIFIELPGADDSERIKKIIQNSALLEFYKVYELPEIDQTLGKINDILRTKLGLDEDIIKDDVPTSSIEEKDSTLTSTSDSTLVDDGLGTLADNANTNEEDTVQKENPLYKIFSPNVRKTEAGNYNYAGGPVIGYVLGTDRDKLREYFEMDEVKSILPRDLKFMFSAKPFKNEDGTPSNTYFLYAIKSKNNKGEAFVSGKTIIDAYNSKDPVNGLNLVNMSMNADGSRRWAKLTKECNPNPNSGNDGKSIAVCLDNKVFSAPMSNGEITGGRTQISGNFTLAEAEDLANILKSGKMDAQLNIPQEAVVGASMGKSAISAGLISLIIGFLLVIIFMVLYYGGAGIIANIALMVNIVLIMGALTSLQAALTLPGIAGIVLTIGMAVDANVIIFERIREELRKGKGLRLAISDGFTHSYSAIIDANVTTLIAGIVLVIYGAGPTKGFAVVLIIGIIASFISAVFLSRIVFDWWLKKSEKTISFSNNFSANDLTKSNFDFVGKRKMFYMISGIILIGGLISIFTRGFELGVDFKGGRAYVIEFDQDVSTDKIREKLSIEFGEESTVKRYDVDSKVQITTAYLIEDESSKVDSIIVSKLYAGLKDFYIEAPSISNFTLKNILQKNKVDTSIADDIKISAYKAGSIGALLIFFYILIRFRKWQYGAGAILAVVHDILIILSIFSIFQGILPFSLEIEQKFIAAILTIIGYSINDTVVVFDRIREFLNEHPAKDFKTNVNSAINSTLSRTLITSFTTLLVVLLMFLFGGPAIKGFSFALLVGILVGTYSSIFIASSVLIDTWKAQKKISHKINK